MLLILSVSVTLVAEYKELQKNIAVCISLGLYVVSRARWLNIIPQILEWIWLLFFMTE
jgi:hypothetical protein